MVTIGRKRAPPVFKDNPMTVVCAQCQQTFTFMMKNTPRKYCSEECSRLMKRTNMRKVMNELRVRRHNQRRKKKLIPYAGYDGSRESW